MLALIPLLPFVGFLVNASMGRRLSRAASGSVACAAMAGAFAISALSVWQLIGLPADQRAIVVDVFRWISAGDFEAAFHHADAIGDAPRAVAALEMIDIAPEGQAVRRRRIDAVRHEADSHLSRYRDVRERNRRPRSGGARHVSGIR